MIQDAFNLLKALSTESDSKLTLTRLSFKLMDVNHLRKISAIFITAYILQYVST